MSRWSWLPITIFFTLACLVPYVWADTGSVELAQKFCLRWDNAVAQGNSVRTEAEWNHLFEGWGPSATSQVVETPENQPPELADRLTACVSRFQKDFEEGAFALRGLEALDRMERAVISTPQEETAETSLTLLKARRRMYSDLWIEFTRDLRVKATSPSFAAQSE